MILVYTSDNPPGAGEKLFNLLSPFAIRLRVLMYQVWRL